MGSFDTITWQALTAILTLAGVAGTVAFWRRRGPVAGLRMLAVALLPAAAYLTGTLRLVWEIGDAVVRWATRLVLSPSVWVGIVLAGVSVLILVLAGALSRRGPAAKSRASGTAQALRAPGRRSVGSGASRDATSPSARTQDDDLDEIEAILRRHGIS